MSKIQISNLQFSYLDNQIFRKLNFYLGEGKSLSIVGASGTGKTTLLKLLKGGMEYEGEILINDKLVGKGSGSGLKDSVLVVFRDSIFLCDTVKDELKFGLENMGLEPSEIQKRIDFMNDFFCVKNWFSRSVSSLNKVEKVLLMILSSAIMYPAYLAIDDLMCELSERNKILLVNYLKCISVTLINVTSDMEEVMYTDNLLCLYDGISAIDGQVLDVLKNETVLKRLGFSLPFIIDLSIKLNMYSLLDKIYFSKEVLVKDLWK